MTLRKKNQRKKQVPNTDDEIIDSRPVVRKKVVMPCRPCNIVMPAEKRKSAPSLIIQPARTQQSTSVATTEQVKRKDPPTSLVQPLFLFQTLHDESQHLSVGDGQELSIRVTQPSHELPGETPNEGQPNPEVLRETPNEEDHPASGQTSGRDTEHFSQSNQSSIWMTQHPDSQQTSGVDEEHFLQNNRSSFWMTPHPESDPTSDSDEEESFQNSRANNVITPNADSQQPSGRSAPITCHGCGDNNIVYLRAHLRNSPLCYDRYRQMYGIADLTALMKRIYNDRRNEHRRQDRNAGNMRNRQEELLRGRGMNREERFELNVKESFEKFCIFCKSLSGVIQLDDDDEELLLHEREVMYRFQGSYFMCTTCSKIRDTLQDNLHIENQLAGMIRDSRDMDEIIGRVGVIQTLTEAEHIEGIYFPKVADTSNRFLQPGNEDVLPIYKAMVFKHYKTLKKESHEKHKLWTKHILERNESHNPGLMNHLYQINDIKLKKAKNGYETGMKKIINARVEEGRLIKEPTPQSSSFMKQFKGSVEYQKNRLECREWSICQNGKNILTINHEICSEKFTTQLLSKIILETDGIKTITSEGQYIVPCQNNGEIICDVRQCENEHKSPLSSALEQYPDGIIPESRSCVVANYIKKYVSEYITLVIQPNSIHHSLDLAFLTDGSVFLQGQIWIRQLERWNKTNEKATEIANLPPDLNKDYIQLSHGPLDVEDRTLISRDLQEHFGDEEKNCLREASLVETIMCLGSGYQIHWSDQKHVTFDIRNFCNQPQSFRKKKPEEQGEVYYTESGEAFVRTDNIRKAYTFKPEAVDHLTGGQFAHMFGYLDKRNKRRYEEKKEELRANNGILGETLTPVICDFDKYPDKTRFLPEMILLKNGVIMKIKSGGNVVRMIGSLDHYGLRVLLEPFKNEQDLANEIELPPREVLEERLKMLFPSGNYRDMMEL